MPHDNDPVLDLHEIQGDVLVGLQKNFENFIFFKIVDVPAFKTAMRRHVIGLVTTTQQAHDRDLLHQQRKKFGEKTVEQWPGLNVSFTKDGLTELLGAKRPELDASFEKGADERCLDLNDPPPSTWISQFRSDRIDGVFLVTGPDESFVKNQSQKLLTMLGNSVEEVYSEIGHARPGAERGHEHFGFLDRVSQPGIRGFTQRSKPVNEPNQGLPGQDLIWPGQFVFGYPGQDPNHPTDKGPEPRMEEKQKQLLRNGSYMVFRRLVQRVPEFHTFVREQADMLGVHSELLASLMVGRWRSGAPLLLAPLQDNIALGKDPVRNNDFKYSGDPLQQACPFAAHIRKANPRDDQNKADVQTHRIMRAGIPFGPEVGPDEATETARSVSRGLMFVCYQTSIQEQFEFLQSKANDVAFVGGKTRRSNRGQEVVEPGFDPIIGQAPGGGSRSMEIVSPKDNSPHKLHMPNPWVVLTAAAYLFVPSITALRTVLTEPIPQ